MSVENGTWIMWGVDCAKVCVEDVQWTSPELTHFVGEDYRASDGAFPWTLRRGMGTVG